MKTINSKEMQKWGVAGLVALAVVGGLWWYFGQKAPASTTGVTTTGSSETSGAGQVKIETSAQSVSAIVRNISNGTRFASLLSSTGVAASLTGRGPYTVFVSTDGAFARLPAGTISKMSPAELKLLIQNHIVAGKRLDVDAVSSGQIQSLARETLNFQVDTVKGAVYVNSGYVLRAYKASNGIVYVINSVLLPPVR